VLDNAKTYRENKKITFGEDQVTQVCTYITNPSPVQIIIDEKKNRRMWNISTILVT
jgi:hypothetical protein